LFPFLAFISRAFLLSYGWLSRFTLFAVVVTVPCFSFFRMISFGTVCFFDLPFVFCLIHFCFHLFFLLCMFSGLFFFFIYLCFFCCFFSFFLLTIICRPFCRTVYFFVG